MARAIEAQGPGSWLGDLRQVTEVFHFLALKWDPEVWAESVSWTCCVGFPGVSNETWNGDVCGVSSRAVVIFLCS